MKFSFYWDILAGKIFSKDANFYLITEFNPEKISNLKPYQIFPDLEFYQSLIDNFEQDSRERVHFYNYIYTANTKRVRISGTAEKDASGYRFLCETKKLNDATVEEVSRKNELLLAVNEASLKFLNEDNWQAVILPVLEGLQGAGDYSFLNLWQFGHASSNRQFFHLMHSTLNIENKYYFLGKDFENHFTKLKNSESIILHAPIEFFKNEFEIKNQLLIPVLISNYFWGVLEIANYNKRRWNSDEILTLESFTKILASAIKSSTLNKKLKDAYAKLNLITETTGSVLYSQKKTKNKLDYVSQSAKAIFGKEYKKFKNLGIQNFLLNEKNAELHYGSAKHKIYKIKETDGEIKYISDKKFNWIDDKGNIKGELGILQDITESAEFENKIKRSNSIFAILNEFTQKVLTTKYAAGDLHTLLKSLGEKTSADRIYFFTGINQNSEFQPEAVWLNLHLDSSEHQNIYKLDFNIDVKHKFINQLKSGRNYISDEKNNWNEAKSSAVFPIFVYGDFYGFIGFDSFCAKHSWEESELSAFEIVAKVISAAIELENFVRNLEEAKREAEKSDRLKSEFIAQISHEIRTPVNLILSFLGILWDELREHDSNENITKIYDKINLSSKRLVRSIDLLIEASEIQSGVYQPDFKELNLIEDLVEPTFRLYKLAAEKKGLQVIRNSNSVLTTIHGDSKTISEILDNLLSNAVKYTNKGKIEINDFNKDDRLILEISDSGDGISEEYLDNIFKPFTQEHEGYARKYDGMGLGMFIVKSYCKLNNINLKIDSSPGKGTKFILEFPLMDFWKTTERRETQQE